MKIKKATKEKSPNKKTRGTAKTKCAPEAAAPVGGVEMIDVESVLHAEWNPRTDAELAADHPAMVELVNSIKAVGLINPITVWESASGERWCIAGNRRLEAVKLAGMTQVAAIIHTSLTEEQARAITRTENEVRFGVSPLADAKQIRQLTEHGLDQSQIAALFGVSEATVCRRAKLLEIDKTVMQTIRENKLDIGAKSLEIIAAYPPELQREADLTGYATNYGMDMRPATMRKIFARLTCRINPKSWIFTAPGCEGALEGCLFCAKCTGNQPTLFDNEEDFADECRRSSLNLSREDYLGQCLDRSCYAAKESAAKNAIIDAAIAKAAGKKFGLVEGRELLKYRYCGPVDWDNDLTAKPSKENNCAYVVWNDYNHTADVKFGRDPKIIKAEKKHQKEDYDAAVRAASEKSGGESDKETGTGDAKIDAETTVFMEAAKKIREWFMKDVANGEYDSLDDAIKAKLATLPAETLAEAMIDNTEIAIDIDDCDGKLWLLWVARQFPDCAATLTDADKTAIALEAGEDSF